ARHHRSRERHSDGRRRGRPGPAKGGRPVIRINLLAVERKAAKKAGAAFQTGQKLTVACSAILVLAALLVGWRYLTLQRESSDLDKAIADAQQETTRLHSIIAQVQTFEQQKAQLQQRVVLVAQLRKRQTGRVHM